MRGPLPNRLVIPAVLVIGWAGVAAVFGAGVPWVVLPAAAVLLALVILGASLNPRWRLFGPALSRVDGADGVVALTFDDGPDPHSTPAVLDALDAAGAKGTFFVVGSRVAAAPELTRAIVERGHQVGHHSYAHRWELFFVRRRLQDDYARAVAAIEDATGRVPRFYRPPVGIVTPEVMDVAEGAGATLAAWSVRPYDGSIDDPEEVRRRVSDNIRAGDVVLLHDGCLRGKRSPPVTGALPAILEDLAARGLRSVTLAELTGQPAYLDEAPARPLRRSPIPLLVGTTLLALLVGTATAAFAGDTSSAADQPGDAAAAPTVLPPSLVEAATELARHGTVRAKFTQTKTSVLFMEPMVQTGELLLRRADDRIVWAYDDGPAILLAGGKVYPLGSDEHADGIPMPGGTGLTAMFDALFGVDPAALAEHFTGVPADGKPGTWTLTPRSEGARALFESVELTIDGAPRVLRRVAMSEVTGDVTTVEFADVEPGAELPAERLQTPRERGETP